MKQILPVLLVGAATLAAQPPRPAPTQAQPLAARNQARQVPNQVPQSPQGTVNRASMMAVEKIIDARLLDLNAADPSDLLGNSRGVYLPGFGVVLSAEVALVKLPGPSPFHQNITQDERTKAHARKVLALPLLKEAMKALLFATGAEFRSIPVTENVVISVSLFSFYWEDTSGLPAQIVMQASRQQLLGKQADSIRVQEF